MNIVYIINSEGLIEAVDYNELLLRYVEETTTPLGIGPKLHVREEIWFKVAGHVFENKPDAENTDNLLHPIEEVTRFEGWTWGTQGNFPKRLLVFDTQEEADGWLLSCAEIDFQNDCDAPLTFKTHAEAEAWIADNI